MSESTLTREPRLPGFEDQDLDAAVQKSSRPSYGKPEPLAARDVAPEISPYILDEIRAEAPAEYARETGMPSAHEISHDEIRYEFAEDVSAEAPRQASGPANPDAGYGVIDESLLPADIPQVPLAAAAQLKPNVTAPPAAHAELAPPPIPTPSATPVPQQRVPMRGSAAPYATNFDDVREGLEGPSERAVRTTTGEILSAKYSFETFIVGKSNQFAHASAMAVADKPSVYNPLFIAGKTGLGKTHLIKAIGYRIGSTRPDLRICYCSTQKFIEEVIQSIRHDTRHQLHEKYQANCDILLMDDIQFLSRATSTQDEFFHIFNSLYDAGKQIIITSDRLPKEISDVHDRIISRFEWGMVADVEAPELETRVAILKARAEMESIELTDEVAYLIGTYVKSNIRELEGSLTKLAGHAAIYNVPITMELVKKVLKNYISDKQRIISIEDIIASVSQLYSIKPSDIRGPSRKGPVARARQIVMFLSRELAFLSSSAIGQELGNRHHTTVLHGHTFIQNEMKADPVLKGQIRQMENLLLNK